MSEWFADTSGWGNLFDITQPYHEQTAHLYRLARQENTRLVTTNYVLAELVALFISPLRISRPQTIHLINSIKSSPYVEIVHIDEGLDELSWQLLANRPDKAWSLVDCASFVLMEKRDISQALTADHHFEQAGFTCLLK